MGILSSGFNILLIIIGFGVLIFIHELGHFIAAKWAGIRTEAFAVGMGPVALAWRKGIGLRFGSTAPDYERRVRDHIKGSGIYTKDQSSDQAKDVPQAEMYRIGDQLGLGETEYSLRYLPIGGFVKMLGQEDANPNYVSNDPRSYTMCPVGKRMIVVSAGVIMNILLAVVLFIIAFTVGVRFEAPVVGDVSSVLAAGKTMPDNAQALGITEPGLQAGDVVTHIDGEPARTFADLQIASAMSRPGVAIKLKVERDGVAEPLLFTLRPEKDPTSGLLGIGIGPGKSTCLWEKDPSGDLRKVLVEAGLDQLKPGMCMVRANEQEIRTYQQFARVVEQSAGKPVVTEWVAAQDDDRAATGPVTAAVQVEPTFQALPYPDPLPQSVQTEEYGLFGLTPLAKVELIVTDDNSDSLRTGDIFLRVGRLEGPRAAELQQEVSRHAGKQVELLVLRDGREVVTTADVSSEGRIGVLLRPALEVPLISRPMESIKPGNGAGAAIATPAAALDLFPRTRIDAVAGSAVSNWADIRMHMRHATAAALGSEGGATVTLATTLPTPGREQEMVNLQLSAADVKALHELTWTTSKLGPEMFEAVQVTLHAEGSPLRAVAMGFAETKKLVVMTYLTIDRLFRGSVGVDQLRGPVGIIHIGSKVADRGFMYIIFFLGMISVNLAVINFLPMPIVDGGLFLFLIYEKFKGRPPSLAFQNVATMVGLFIIGTLFLVTFYNDVLRLLS